MGYMGSKVLYMYIHIYVIILYIYIYILKPFKKAVFFLLTISSPTFSYCTCKHDVSTPFTCMYFASSHFNMIARYHTIHKPGNNYYKSTFF